jgi:outer membrane beta-barrel protein
LLPALLAALVLPASALAAQPASQPAAGEAEADPAKLKPVDLHEKMPPVSGRLFLKNGRLELSPTVSASLADAFFQKYGLGLKLNYHFAESISVGLFASYAFNMPSGVVSVCRSDGSCVEPGMEDLQQLPGKLGMLAGIDLAWAPIYGKFNVFSEQVLHFDVALIAGANAIQYEAPDGNATFAVGGHFGLGQRYFITPSMTLRIELRDYIYSGKTVQVGNWNSKLENQIMFELGLSYFAGAGSED